jgi:hypothetical protein
MGIYSLKTFIDKYIKEAFEPSKIHSEVCYIDFTYKICISTARVYNIYKEEQNNYTNPLDLIYDILEKDIELLCNQIFMNRFFKKFIIAFDYGMQSKMSTQMHFSEDLLEAFKRNMNKNTMIKSSVMIPRKLIEHLNDKDYEDLILDSAKHLNSIRYNQNRLIDNIPLTSYISIEKIKDKMPEHLYKKIKYNALCKYIATIGCKEVTRLKRKRQEITCGETTEESFDETFKEKIMDINPSYILACVPYIIHEVKQRVGDEYVIEFIGTSTESDFSILKHIETYHKNNCPTIYTNDTDFFTLLGKYDVVIKFPYQNEKTKDKFNVSIKPIDFWNWLLKDQRWSYYDIITLSCLLGTDYNKESPFHIRTIDKIRKYYYEHKTKSNDPEYMYSTTMAIARDALKYSDKQLPFLLAMELYYNALFIESQIYFIQSTNYIRLDIMNEKKRCIYVDIIFKSITETQ